LLVQLLRIRLKGLGAGQYTTTAIRVLLWWRLVVRPCVARFHNHLTVQAHRWHGQISVARSFLIRRHPATVHIAVRSGQVWSPDRDKTYNSRLQLIGDTLAVSGCVFGICRDGGAWIRN
jgi:hypothetical protein